MDVFEYLSAKITRSEAYHPCMFCAASPDALQACEAAIGIRLSESVVTILERCNGFELRRAEGKLSSRPWIYAALGKDTDCWGDLIEVAKSNESESTYAIRPVLQHERESPLFEIWPEGCDDLAEHSAAR